MKNFDKNILRGNNQKNKLNYAQVCRDGQSWVRVSAYYWDRLDARSYACKVGTSVAKQLATFFSLFGIKNAVHRCTYQLHKISLDLATALAIMLWQFDWIGTLGQKLILLFCVIISTTGPVVAPCPDWARGQNVS